MEVTVVSSRGKKEHLALDPNWSVTQLKKELHTRLPTLSIPAPEEQKLINAYGRLLQGDDENEPISTFCKPGDDLIVLPRRFIPTTNSEATQLPPRETQPAVSLTQVNAAIKEENERLAALGEPPPPIVPSPPPAAARGDGLAADRLEGSIRALVEGNFEQLRGYLEQLQEAVARQGIGGDEIMFGMPGDDEEDEDEGMDEGDDGEEEEEDEEDGAGLGAAAAAMMGGPGGGPIQIPQVEEAALAELLAMGFPDQLSRNALLLHRNRLQPAVDWALSHVDDAEGNQPLAEEVLAAVYGPQRRLGGPGGAGAGAYMARRRPRLPPGQVDTETLNSMIEMGFDREHSARALAYTGNRLEDACQLILNGMPLPPLPEQQPDAGGDGAGAAGAGEGAAGEAGPSAVGAVEAGNPAAPGAVPVAEAAPAQAAAAAAEQPAEAPLAGGDGEDDDGMHDEEEDDDDDEHWDSDEDEDVDIDNLDGGDIEHAMDIMFGGLVGGGDGEIDHEGEDWMGEEEEEGWNSEDDEVYDDEVDDLEDHEIVNYDDGYPDGHPDDAPPDSPPGNGGEEGAEGASPPPAPEAPPQDPQSQSQQPAPSSGTGGNTSGQ